MKTPSLLRALLFLLLLSFAASSSIAQDTGKLAIDSQITRKTLPNGLTYYIRKNKKPENRATFRLVVNAGSILETEKEQGLAHFLEHMAFNGTKNFAKSELVDFLEGIGMKFGADLNAYTSFDETVYKLEVPMDDEVVLDKTFQVLEDWAHLIVFEPEEIEKERGVVIEEWRTRRNAQGRLQEKQLPVLLNNSLYAERLPIGKTNVISSVQRQTFVDFYRRWYRPDLMAVIAVGDFDVDAIEAKIVKHFGHLKNPENAPKRIKPDVPDHKETLFSIETDPELPYSMVQIACKHPVSSQDTAEDYRRGLVERLYSTMLNQRLGERVQEANPPYLFGAMRKNRLVRVKEMAAQMAVVKEGDFANGLKALLVEARRAEEHGFTPTELNRAKADFLRGMEKAYEERDKTVSSRYADEYVRNFLQNEPIRGIEEQLRITREALVTVKLEEVNRAADRWITTENRVVLFSAPEKTGLKVPTREEILNAIASAEKVPVTAYDDGMTDAPLISREPKPGKVISEKRDEKLGVTEWKLSNDITVLLKPTTFKNDQILMTASSPGGDSLVSNKDYLSGSMATTIAGQSGLGSFDLIQLQKKLAGKVASVSPSIGGISEGLGGSASPRDLDTWFQLMHLQFGAPRQDAKAFKSLLAQYRAVLRNRSTDPQSVFGDAVEEAMYGDHPRHQPMSVELLEELDHATALRVYQQRFADASDFTFVFVGSFEPEDLKPYVEKYLASLPDLDREEKGRHTGDNRQAGRVSVEVRKGREDKSSVQLTFHGAAKWSMKDRYALRCAVDVLRIQLREALREDKGGVYGVGVSGGMSREPKETFSCNISFTCSPANVNDLIKTALAEAKKLQQEGPSEENLAKIRETHLRTHEKGLKQNGFWLSNLSFYRRCDLPFAGILEGPEKIEAMTSKEIQGAARKYFSRKNMLTAKLFPEIEKPSGKPAK